MSEIERKFLVDRPPASLPLGDDVEQAYVAIDDAGGVEVRVRRRSAGERASHRLTVKGGSGVERAEVEIEIEAAMFDELRSLAGDRVIRKRRYELDVGDLIAELDEYQGPLDGLWTVEVEFTNRADADAFEPPSWFGDEVTGDDRWSNAALARHGRPTE